MNKTKIFFTGMILLLLATFIITFQRYYKTNQNIKEDENKIKTQYNEKEIKNDKNQTTSNKNNKQTFSNEISEEELLKNQRNAILIDLRSKIKHEEAHIKGSIPINKLPKDYDKNKLIVLITDKEVDPSILQTALSVFSKDSKVKIYSGSMRSFDEKGGNIIIKKDINKITDLSKVDFISPSEAYNLVQKNKDLTIVDVRRVGNFEKSHINGAINIPYSELEQRYQELPVFSHNILVYGATREQSFLAGALLSDLGIFDAKTLDGGYEEYQKFVLEKKSKENDQKEEETKNNENKLNTKNKATKHEDKSKK